MVWISLSRSSQVGSSVPHQAGDPWAPAPYGLASRSGPGHHLGSTLSTMRPVREPPVARVLGFDENRGGRQEEPGEERWRAAPAAGGGVPYLTAGGGGVPRRSGIRAGGSPPYLAACQPSVRARTPGSSRFPSRRRRGAPSAQKPAPPTGRGLAPGVGGWLRDSPTCDRRCRSSSDSRRHGPAWRQRLRLPPPLPAGASAGRTPCTWR